METELCQKVGVYHEYRIQQGYVICALHGTWLGRIQVSE